MSELVLFDPNASSSANLPAHLQGLGLGTTQSLMAIIGDQLNRIGLKGCRFRQFVAGNEVGIWEENFLDVIIVAVVPTLSRIYYAGKFKQSGDNDPPTCYSPDNVAPPLDLATRQSDACATCPQNIKGSKVTDEGMETKACGYFRRLVVMLPGDPTLYRIDVKAQGLFGDSHDKLNKYSLNDYAKFLNARGVDASLLVTRLTFDTDISTPKLLFSPTRYITQEEAADVQSFVNSKTLEDYLAISFKTIDLSKETPAPEADVPAAAAPTVQAQAAPQTQPQRAAATSAPQTARPTPTATQRPTPQAQRPAPTGGVQVDSGVTAAPAKPATQAPKPVQQQAKPAAQAPKPVQQAAAPVQEVIPAVQEVGSESELASLISDLGI